MNYKMNPEHWIKIISWILILGCFPWTCADEDDAPRDFSVLRNVLDASKIESCDDVPKRGQTHSRQRRSIEGMFRLAYTRVAVCGIPDAAGLQSCVA